jgi:hypothetical protein
LRNKIPNPCKRMTWYVVEVSLRKGNPIHRAVCFHSSHGYFELFGSYDNVIRTNLKDLNFFNIIEPIKMMNSNRNKLSPEALEFKNNKEWSG